MEKIHQSIKKRIGEAANRVGDFIYNELIPRLPPHFGIVIKIDEQEITSKVYVFTGWQLAKLNKPFPVHEIITVPTDQLHQQQIQPADLVKINYERDRLTLYSRFENIVEKSLELGKELSGKNREKI